MLRDPVGNEDKIHGVQPDLVQSREDAEALFGEDFGDVAVIVDPTVAENDNLGLQPEGLFDVMRDGDYGDTAVQEGFAKFGEDGVA